MRSRMNSYKAVLPESRLFFISLALFFAVSCATGVVQEKDAGLDGTVSGKKTAVDENTVKEDSPADYTGIWEFNDAEFAGNYKLTGDPICGITLVIKKDSDGFLYTFSGSITGSGRIGLDKKDGQVYVYFNRIGCGGENYPVIGLYSHKTILIQRYGDSRGNTACFRDCDSKILRFIKN